MKSRKRTIWTEFLESGINWMTIVIASLKLLDTGRETGKDNSELLGNSFS